MNRLYFSFALYFLVAGIYAQEGDFFVSQFSPTFGQEDQIYFDLKFTENDELIAANRSGIVRFDGSEWNLIPTPSAPLSVALDSQMNIYVACAGDFGKIVIEEGGFVFRSLAPLPTDKVFTKQVLLFEDRVYFLQDDRLFTYHPLSEAISYIDADSASGSFIYLFPYENALRLESLAASYTVGEDLQRKAPVVPDSSIVINMSRHAGTGRTAFASADGNIYIVDRQLIAIPDLDGKVVTDMDWVSDDLLVVATLSEGIFFYSFSKEEIIAITDAGNGLPDNEVFAIAVDRSQGLWVANTFGFSRIAPLLPIKSFNHYPGLSGNLTTAMYSENTWYIATSDGVYFFDELNNYKNIVYYVPKTTVKKPVSNKPAATKTSSVEEKDTESNSRFSFLRRNEDKEDRVLLQRKDSEQPVMLQLKKNVTRLLQTGSEKAGELISRIKLPIADSKKVAYERRVRKELISTQYFYEKIPDVSEKIKQLITFDDAIIAVTPTGIIEIRDGVAEEIFSEPVRYVYRPGQEKALWVSTQAGIIYKLEEVGKVWLETQKLASLSDVILSMYSDTINQVWMAGTNELFELSVSDTSISVRNRYPIENQFFDQIKLTRIQDQLALINNQGIFLLDTASNAIITAPDLLSKIGNIRKHLQQSDGRVWVHNGSNWHRIEEDGRITSYTYLKLFPDMSFIEQTEDEIWLINDYQSLFKFLPSELDSIPPSQMFLKEIKDAEGLVNPENQKLKISYERNSVFLELARPDYMGLSNVQYSYRMRGLSDEWSEWSSNNKLAFNYLPAGSYTLEIRSIDALGRQQELTPLEIKITPPYWQTTWFSALQVVFFAALVLIASRVNRTNTASKKQMIISNLLTIVTIVMIIELLQNIAESYVGDAGSPVLAFGLDVFVALLIFPVEMLLRRIVTGNKSPIAQAAD